MWLNLIDDETLRNTEFIYNLSYGKDSMAGLHVTIDILGIPVSRIVHAEVWATDSIPADLPPMVEFKRWADGYIKGRWGLTVEHICATRGVETHLLRYFPRTSRARKTRWPTARIPDAARVMVQGPAQVGSPWRN